MGTNDTSRDHSREIDQIIEIARKLDLPIGRIKRAGSEANLVGIRTDTVLISRRLDSRTWFVHDLSDRRKSSDAFNGPDRMLRERGRKILRILNIPSDEVGEQLVLQEHERTAKVERGGKLTEGRDQKGAKLLRIHRAIQGIPVWSSNVILRPGKDGRILFLQAHWPELSAVVIEEASELAHRIQHDWCPPPRESASPESIEAGVVHSPALGFVMDVYAAIRVIYEPWNRLYGRKVTLHLDRHGRPTPRPRIAELPEETSEKRQEPRTSGE